MDGLEATHKIIEMGVKTPIVALTANVMSDALDVYMASGISDIVGKPFTAKELWKCLIKYFHNNNYSVSGEQNKPIPAKEGNKKAETEKDDDEFLLESMRRTFVKDHQETYAKIIGALDSNDTKTAYRLVHSLKSNAGFIKEKLLYEVAAKLESLLSEESRPVGLIEGYLDVIKKELEAILEKLAHLLPQETEDTVGTELNPADTDRILEIFERLEPLLKMNHSDSLDYADELRGISGLGELVSSIEKCGFKQALSILETIIRRIKN
jgi:HPt (histidine-containing phosphotransfer) domain-containing protein